MSFLFGVNHRKNILAAAGEIVFFLSTPALAQTNWQAEWAQRLESAKKDGKVVLSIPPVRSSEKR
jgi:hypothetical protein